MDKKENIIILFPDQLRADALSCNGCLGIETPNIDRLANGGVNYINALSPTPLCVPARASMLTGDNSVVTGVINNSGWLRPDKEDIGVKTWPQKLKNVGYTTAAIGKMHFYPWDKSEGFDHRVIAEDKRHIHIQDDYQIALKERGYKRTHGNEAPGYYEDKGAFINTLPSDLQIDTWVTDQTINYLEENNFESPFAVMVGFPGPHCPYDPPSEYLDLVKTDLIPDPINSTDDWMKEKCVQSNLRPWNGVDYSDLNSKHIKKIRHHYLAMVKQLDDNVGRILEYLEKSGLADNTTIIFSSDHGDFLGDRGLIGKMFFHAPSVNIPLLIKGKGYTGNSKESGLISLTDLHSVILDIAGIKEYNHPESKHVFGYLDSGYFIAFENWRYSIYDNGSTYLYNVGNDPDEQVNLVNNSEFVHVVNELNMVLFKKISDSLVRSNADKLLVPGTEEPGKDPSNSFYNRDWVRPYPGNINLI